MLFPYNFIPDKAEFFFIHGIAEKKRKQELKYYMLKVSTITFEQCSQTFFNDNLPFRSFYIMKKPRGEISK